MTTVVFLDTMLFMHYRPLDDLDWCAALGATAVRIVVPRVTIRELDDHKDSHPNATLKERARKAGRLIADGLTVIGTVPETTRVRRGKVIREHVTLELQGLTLPFDFEAAQLDERKNDDQLIAAMLTFRAAEPEVTLVLVSGDQNARLTAEDFGLGVLEPSEDWRLPAAPDPLRRELEALRAENVRLKASHPKLRVLFAHADADAPETCVRVACASGDDEPRDTWAAALATEALAVPERTVGDQPEVMPPSRPHSGLPRIIVTFAIQPPTPEEYARYATERTAYLAAFDAYQRERWAYESRVARLVDLALVVENSGSGVADDVEVHITVPAPLEIIESGVAQLFRTAPHAPKQPDPPRTLGQQALRGLAPFGFGSSHGASALAYQVRMGDFGPRTVPNASDHTVHGDGARVFVWHVRRVKHGVDVPLPVVTVTWPTGVPMTSLALEVTVHAANLPTPVRDQLHLRVVGCTRE